ncbi:MAG: preQ(1) synthase [Desulfobacteraceae bacterium]|nr:preQ(1) synthase [Desulfobacteraceae bacterium]
MQTPIRSQEELKNITHLGNQNTEYKTDYDPTLLEVFANRHPNKDQWVSFVCTEFTSLCPMTNQPDYARIFINYIAKETMVESKSLKLYLFSFRNHGDFHEDCIQKICNDIARLIKPKFLEVIGEFTPRGGIAIYPYSSYHNKEAKYEEIYMRRLSSYVPGKFTMNLGRPY